MHSRMGRDILGVAVLTDVKAHIGWYHVQVILANTPSFCEYASNPAISSGPPSVATLSGCSPPAEPSRPS